MSEHEDIVETLTGWIQTGTAGERPTCDMVTAREEIVRLRAELARAQNEKAAFAEMRNDAVDDREAIRSERDETVARAGRLAEAIIGYRAALGRFRSMASTEAVIQHTDAEAACEYMEASMSDAQAHEDKLFAALADAPKVLARGWWWNHAMQKVLDKQISEAHDVPCIVIATEATNGF